MNIILRFFKKIFGKKNSNIRLPKSVNGVADIKSSCASPHYY